MKLIHRTQSSRNEVTVKESTVPVHSNPCGRVFDEIVLNAEDMDKLAHLGESDPKALAAWVGNLRVRFTR